VARELTEWVWVRTRGGVVGVYVAVGLAFLLLAVGLLGEQLGDALAAVGEGA